MIVRVLVLLVAMLASTERVHADIAGDTVTITSLDEVEAVDVTRPPAARHVDALAPPRVEHSIAPAPALAPIFRPPRVS